MCKSFLYRELFSTIVLALIFHCSSFGQQELYSTRSLDLSSSYHEDLYHFVLAGMDPYEDIGAVQDIDRQRIVSLLHTRYPELTYELERTPKQTLTGKEVSSLLVQILKEETAADVVDTKDGFWGIVEEAELDKTERANFQFLYGYELFKQKRFTEADKVFDKIIKERKGEFEYAFYYSGLIALMDKNYKDAQEKLKKIGFESGLRSQTPYYLAASHYGQKRYNDVVKFYSPRINEQGLHNIAELNKIVAYAQYKTGDYQGAIASLKKLDAKRSLSDEENYVLGIAYQKTGHEESSASYLSNVAQVGGDLSVKAAYEYALTLADQGKNHEALTKFEGLINSNDVDKNEIIWNLAVLNGRLKNYDKLAYHATTLLSSAKKDDALELLKQVLNNVDNDRVYTQIVIALNDQLLDKSILKSSVYNKAILALKSHQKDKAKTYFTLLSDIDPLIEERGVVAAWKGIMAYEDGNYKKASRLFKNYQESRPNNAPASQLDFDASYFMAYSQFKLKNHSDALGHFSQAYQILQSEKGAQLIADAQIKKNDINLRLGDSYFLLDEHDSAKKAYARILDNNSINKDYALWQTATIAELENRLYDQIITLDEIITEYPGSKYYHRAKYNTANSLFTLKKYDKAASFYNQVITSNVSPHLVEESTMQLGLISVNAGIYSKAENHFKQLIDNSKNPDIVQRSRLALKEIYSDYTNNTEAYLDLIATNDTEATSDKDERVSALSNLAQENFDKGKTKEAIEQWNKLTQDYPNTTDASKALWKLAEAYTHQEKWLDAFITYRTITMSNPALRIEDAFENAEDIAYQNLKDHQRLLELNETRKKNHPNIGLTSLSKLRNTIALLNTGNSDEVLESFSSILNDAQFTPLQKKTLFTSISIELIKKDRWTDLISTYKSNDIAFIVSKDPKLIYQRSLAYFNVNNLDKATTSITDYYDTLLQEPAWLAKGIILISDIYVLQDDKDGASVALEALINTDSNIPPSLITVAKERLKALELQN